MDYLKLNIGILSETNPTHPTIRFIDSIFALPHNQDNTDRVEDFMWADTSQVVAITFAETPMGEAAEIHLHDCNKPFRIIKISPKWAKNIKYNYRYQLQYYGAFFHAHRQNLLNRDDFLQLFASPSLPKSVSRIDICVDIVGITPMQVKQTVKTTGNSRKWSVISACEQNYADAETIYYGKGNSKKRWFARIYNKIKDCVQKQKIQGYEHYFSHAAVTRIELEITTSGKAGGMRRAPRRGLGGVLVFGV